MTRSLCVLILLCLSGPAWAGTLTITALPATINQSQHSPDSAGITRPDYIVFSGTSLTSTGLGIVFGAGTHDWVLDLSGADGIAGTADDKTLYYATDSTYRRTAYGQNGNARGISFSGTSYNIRIRGGWIKYAAANFDSLKTVWEVSDTMSGWNHGVMIPSGAHDLTFDSVRFVNGGYNSSNVNHAICRQVKFHGCRFWNYQWAYDTRMEFRGGCIRGNDLNITGQTFDWDTDTLIYAYGCWMWSSGQHIVSQSAAAVANPTPGVYLDYDTMIIDGRNLYPSIGTTQTYAIFFRGMAGPSRITNCVITSGERFGGGRGIGFVGRTRGSETRKIEVAYDSIDCNEGTSPEFGESGYPSSVKIREACWWNWWHHNYIRYRADTLGAVAGAAYFRRGEAFIYQQGMDCGGSYMGPYNNVFENNRIITEVADRGARNVLYDVCGLKFESIWYHDPGTIFRNNYIYSNGNAVLGYGSYDGSGAYAVDSGDTLDWQPVSNLAWQATFNNGGYCPVGTVGAYNDTVLDAIYLNDASPTSVVHRWGDNETTNDEQNITISRTLRILVKGNNDLPVTGANVIVSDAYDNVRFTTPSRANGAAIGVYPYRYYSRTGTDLDMTTASVSASKSGTSADTTFTIAWNTVDDTIYLDVAGDGVWDTGDVPAPTDTIITFVNDSSSYEGDSVWFIMTLEPALGYDLTYSYATSDSTTEPEDYTGISGIDTIPAGATADTLVVVTIEDTQVESDEVFKLTLSSFSSGVVRRFGTDSIGCGIILNDDTAAVSSRTRTRIRK